MPRSHGEISLIAGKRVTTPEYRSWQMMRNRCNNPKADDFAHYGGRGIKVCKRWDSYESFLEDMGRRPTPTHTIDRIRTAGNYCKSNCRWATRLTQARNRPYARVKAWVLAEKLGCSTGVAKDAIARVYAKDRGNLSYFDLSPAREAAVRKHLENVRATTI